MGEAPPVVETATAKARMATTVHLFTLGRRSLDGMIRASFLLRPSTSSLIGHGFGVRHESALATLRKKTG